VKAAAIVFALFGIHIGSARVLPVGYAPTWSPTADRIAYVMRGDLWVMDRDGSHRTLLVEDADDPAWGPNGRRLAFTRGGWVWTVRADGEDERRLARGAHPDWSPDGSRIAFDRNGEVLTSLWWYAGVLRHAGSGTDPSYAPDGRLAVVRDGTIVAGGRAIAEGESPDWSPTGCQH